MMAKRWQDLFRLLVWEAQGLADEGAFLLGELEQHGFVARLGLVRDKLIPLDDVLCSELAAWVGSHVF